MCDTLDAVHAVACWAELFHSNSFPLFQLRRSMAHWCLWFNETDWFWFDRKLYILRVSQIVHCVCVRWTADGTNIIVFADTVLPSAISIRYACWFYTPRNARKECEWIAENVNVHFQSSCRQREEEANISSKSHFLVSRSYWANANSVPFCTRHTFASSSFVYLSINNWMRIASGDSFSERQ